MPEPAHNRGRSKQDYATPDDFLQAVVTRLGIQEFMFDFAADETNTVATCFWNADVNSLAQSPDDWADMVQQPSGHGWGWLNMPFANIAPWVELAYRATHVEGRPHVAIAVLVPAGVGSNWWKDWVHDRVRVLLLNGRLKFKGAADWYPKDCCLLLYSQHLAPGYEVWTWRETPPAGG